MNELHALTPVSAGVDQDEARVSLDRSPVDVRVRRRTEFGRERRVVGREIDLRRRRLDRHPKRSSRHADEKFVRALADRDRKPQPAVAVRIARAHLAVHFLTNAFQQQAPASTVFAPAEFGVVEIV